MPTNLLINRRLMLGGLAAVAALPSSSWAASAGDSYPALRAQIDRYVDEGIAPHMLVAVGHRGWPPEFLSAGTQAIGGGPPVGPDTLYNLASMTKPIVAFAVMALIEDGSLSLDTPLADIYPAYANLSVLIDPEHSLETRPAIKQMTIRHLVTHSSGFGADFNVTGQLKELYLGKNMRPWERYPAGSEPPLTPSLDDFAEAAASLPLLFEPGRGWHYSMGFDIAVAIVEKVTSRPFEQFIAERLFDPLGMGDTFYTVPTNKLGRLASTYDHTPEGLQAQGAEARHYVTLEMTNPRGSGGLISSANDYCRFAAMLLGEGTLGRTKVMKHETVRLMMSNLMEPGVPAPTSYGTAGHGAGGRSTIVDVPGGEGVGTYGWGGAYNTMFWVDRTHGAYIVIMTQIAQWFPNPSYQDFREALYMDLARG